MGFLRTSLLQTPCDQIGHPPWAGSARLPAGRLPHFPWPEAGPDPPGRADPVCGPTTATVRRVSRGGMGVGLEAGDQEPDPTEMLVPRLLLHTSFLSPLCTLWLWTKPVARDFLYQAPTRNMTFSLCVLGVAEGPGVPEAMAWGRRAHPDFLSASLLLQTVRRGFRLSAPLGVGGPVPVAAGSDPATPAGLPVPGQGSSGAAAQGGWPH